jgi:molybdopterin-containing oxidoreductase family iron-sulfur binding subunit
VTLDGATKKWVDFAAYAAKQFGAMRGGGDGFVILSEAANGPSAADMKKRVMAAYPKAKWVEYEPVGQEAAVEGSKLAFGKAVRPVLHLDKAATVVSLDADLLGTHPAHIRYAADWSEKRRSADQAGPKGGEMNRVFIAETVFSITGTVADVRLPIDPARLYAIARAIAGKVGVAGVGGEEKLSDADARFVAAAVADLKEGGVVAGGGALSPAGHALVHAINEKIGAFGKTVTLLEDPAGDRPSHAQGLSDLAADMKAGKVNTLLIIGGNPAYDAPADADFANLLSQVANSIHLGLYKDETSKLCHWHLPRAHYLESWGDARAWDGAANVVQPLIMPLYDGKSTIEILAMVAGDTVTEGHEIVQRTWEGVLPKENFELSFRKAMEAGYVEGGYPAARVKVSAGNYPAAEAAQGFYLRFVPDSKVYDGRYANNGWLQETPDTLTKVVWDNPAQISKKDADAIGVTNGDILKIDVGGASLEIAAYVLPGQPVGVITLPLGYGRTSAGHIGDELGFKVEKIRTSRAFDVAAGAKVSKGSGTYKLVLTQDHHILDKIGYEGREARVGEKNESGSIIHETTFAEFKVDPKSAHPGPRKVGLQLFEEPRKDGYSDPHAWGMAIDMNTCIGCNACAVACQAENNIPVVGKVQSDYHREMNWLRIDRYFKDRTEPEQPADFNDVEVVYQPMMCQHCENAPCEQVCPVGATLHDTEGLNTMVYNRCIGTRYCSNNCPYKVRRFNYLDFHSQDPRHDWAVPYPNIPDMQLNQTIDPVLKMVFNPEVTVRMRGVMEKCTYCVQRIHNTTIAKRGQGEEVKDGDIMTACQQTCPTQAIIFGNLADPESRVSKLHKNNRSYAVLHEELDTRPRTKYLAKLRNPADGAKTERKEAVG